MGVNGKQFTESRITVSVISGLLAAMVTFIVVWFTAVNQADQYSQDRQFILSEIQRQGRLIDGLQASSSRSSVQAAELAVQVAQLRQQLDRIEARQRAPYLNE